MKLAGRRLCCAIFPLLLGVAGCSLLDFASTFDEHGPKPLPHSTHRLVDYTPGAPSAIRLEITLIDCDHKDPSLGKPLWSELNQVGAISSETRILLEKNGFRVGVAGSTPPPPLSRLISRGGEPDLDELDNRVSKRELALFPGTETEVITSDIIEEVALSVFNENANRTETYRQARGVFQIRSARVQNGWVELDFIPEIHHGDDRVRRVPTNVGMSFKSGQRQDSQHDLRFRLTLGVGEVAVVSCDEVPHESLADFFFRARTDDGNLRRRTLVVRVIESSEPIQVRRDSEQ